MNRSPLDQGLSEPVVHRLQRAFDDASAGPVDVASLGRWGLERAGARRRRRRVVAATLCASSLVAGGITVNASLGQDSVRIAVVDPAQKTDTSPAPERDIPPGGMASAISLTLVLVNDRTGSSAEVPKDLKAIFTIGAADAVAQVPNVNLGQPLPVTPKQCLAVFAFEGVHAETAQVQVQVLQDGHVLRPVEATSLPEQESSPVVDGVTHPEIRTFSANGRPSLSTTISAKITIDGESYSYASDQTLNYAATGSRWFLAGSSAGLSCNQPAS